MANDSGIRVGDVVRITSARVVGGGEDVRHAVTWRAQRGTRIVLVCLGVEDDGKPPTLDPAEVLRQLGWHPGPPVTSAAPDGVSLAADPRLSFDAAAVGGIIQTLQAASAGRPCGAELIVQERYRQIEGGRWTPAHDDRHNGGELALAAVCYALPLWHPSRKDTRAFGVPRIWPSWSCLDWKPSPDDRIRELVKAGALIAAEIDRLQRLAAREVVGGVEGE